jgi:hypothetical protein
MGMVAGLSFVICLHEVGRTYESASNLLGRTGEEGLVADLEEFLAGEAPPTVKLMGAEVAKIAPPLDYGARRQGHRPFAGAECLLRYFVEGDEWKESCLSAL